MPVEQKPDDKVIRVFFALWPDAAIRRQILNAGKKIPLANRPGLQIRSENLHITLHFIGNIPAGKLNCMKRQARRVSAPGFTLQLDRSGYFPKPGIVWLGCQQIPPELYVLHLQLGQQLSGCGYRPEERKYTPHVSLRRKSSHPELADRVEPTIWQIDHFVLVQSRATPEGVIYNVLETYPLSSAI